jgi:hypothetical protein
VQPEQQIIPQRTATAAVTRLHTKYSIRRWISVAAVSVMGLAIFGLLLGKHHRDPSDVASAIVMSTVIGALGAVGWLRNHRRLIATSKARLLLAHPCESRLNASVLDIKYQTVSVRVPLDKKRAAALALKPLP